MINQQKLIKDALLKDYNSPKKAWYRLQIFDIGLGYIIKKQSGANERLLDELDYFKETLDDANKFYTKKIKEKTNPKRKSRIYSIVSQMEC